MKNSWSLLLVLTLPAAGFAGQVRARRLSTKPAPRATSVQGRSVSPSRVGPSRGFSRGVDQPPPPQDQTPPIWATTPGALIRTEGLGAKVSPAAPERTHAVEAGGKITLDANKAQALTGRGLHVGPKDKLPQPNAGGGASGRTAITPNAPSGE